MVEMGEVAAEALLGALDSRSEGVRWAAMRCLGEIGSTDAVEALLAALQRPTDRQATCWALARITGQDFGEDAKAWLAWAGKEEEEPETTEESAAAAPGMDNETLLREAVRGLTATVEGAGKTRKIEMELEGGRRQVVRVVFTVDSEKSPVVLVYSECAPADPGHYEFALRTNLTLAYGALAIRKVEGEDRLVMFNSLLREGLTPLALKKSIVTIADKADRVERKLTGKDER